MITVLVSTATHPVSGLPCPARNDTLALELARRLSDGTFRTLHAGNPQDPALNDYLAFGAPTVEVLPVAPSDDIASALADQLHDASLVLCGSPNGILPYRLASALKRPILADVLDVQLSGTMARALQFLPKGRRRSVEITLPAIIAVHPLANAAPRYAYARRVSGRIEALPAPACQAAPDPWQLDSTDRVPVRLKAADRRSGHTRMLAATATAAASRGGQVVNQGSSVEKAQAVLAYLREHDLIAFQETPS